MRMCLPPAAYIEGGGLDEWGRCFNASNKRCEAIGREGRDSHFLFISYQILMQILSGVPFLLQHTLLVQFLINIDRNPHWRLLPPPAHIPLSILIKY